MNESEKAIESILQSYYRLPDIKDKKERERLTKELKELVAELENQTMDAYNEKVISKQEMKKIMKIFNIMR